mmetsp:Transcript_15348/g.30168  ORF Transcript_15348/g.30168 Transcript_15348/m.30168 type:complete len:106 (+) Transcript_15348:315-632(+)
MSALRCGGFGEGRSVDGSSAVSVGSIVSGTFRAEFVKEEAVVVLAEVERLSGLSEVADGCDNSVSEEVAVAEMGSEQVMEVVEVVEVELDSQLLEVEGDVEFCVD